MQRQSIRELAQARRECGGTEDDPRQVGLESSSEPCSRLRSRAPALRVQTSAMTSSATTCSTVGDVVEPLAPKLPQKPWVRSKARPQLRVQTTGLVAAGRRLPACTAVAEPSAPRSVCKPWTGRSSQRRTVVQASRTPGLHSRATSLPSLLGQRSSSSPSKSKGTSMRRSHSRLAKAAVVVQEVHAQLGMPLPFEPYNLFLSKPSKKQALQPMALTKMMGIGKKLASAAAVSAVGF